MTRAYEIAAALREFSCWAEYGEDADEQAKMTDELCAAADLIENQQRHIEALMKANDSLKDAIARRDKQIEDMVDRCPTVDAEVVVRCKDCKHYDMGVCLKIYSDGNMHTEAWKSRRPEDFCSYGERKDDKHEH